MRSFAVAVAFVLSAASAHAALPTTNCQPMQWVVMADLSADAGTPLSTAIHNGAPWVAPTGTSGPLPYGVRNPLRPLDLYLYSVSVTADDGSASGLFSMTILTGPFWQRRSNETVTVFPEPGGLYIPLRTVGIDFDGLIYNTGDHDTVYSVIITGRVCGPYLPR